jgi:hypothetical protein
LQIALNAGDAQRFLDAGGEFPDDWELPTLELPDWLLFVWRCWWRLHADRPWLSGGMGPMMPGRIAWRDVVLWADVHDMSGDQFELLDRCVRAMDDTFCAWHAQEREKQRDSK